jgi:hypothetical protein
MPDGIQKKAVRRRKSVAKKMPTSKRTKISN